MTADRAHIVARAILLHMQPSVEMGDGIEAVLLDRSTSLDVRGVGYELVDVATVFPALDAPAGFLDRNNIPAFLRKARHCIRRDVHAAAARDIVEDDG